MGNGLGSGGNGEHLWATALVRVSEDQDRGNEVKGNNELIRDTQKVESAEHSD